MGISKWFGGGTPSDSGEPDWEAGDMHPAAKELAAMRPAPPGEVGTGLIQRYGRGDLGADHIIPGA